MEEWKISPPQSPAAEDSPVSIVGDNLKGKKIASMITGGIASMKAPFICRLLMKYGADITVYSTPEALRYTTRDALHWSTGKPVITELTISAEHLYKFDIYLIAPATYNTINKITLGIADNPVTILFASALQHLENGIAKVLIAPTMHGSMHNSILSENLQKLQNKGVIFIPPRDENGKHNMPDDEVLLKYVCDAAGCPLDD